MPDTTVPFNATFGLAAGVDSTAIILEDATIKPNLPQSYTALQSFSGGISAAGGITFNGTLTGVTATFTRLLTASGGVSAAGGITLASPNLTDTPTATTAALGTNTTQIATTAFVQNEIIADTVTTFNGRTGAVQGVSAAAAGTGIAVSGATGSVTITNIGVQSFNGTTGAVTGVSSVNGSTGAVTNVALTNIDNYFSASQTISAMGALFAVVDTNSANAFEFDPATKSINCYDDIFGETTSLKFNHTFAQRTVELPDANTTLAGLSVTQTFTAINTFTAGLSAAGGITFNGTLTGVTATFNRLLTASGGFSAAGATFSGNISAPNIVNSFNGLTGAVSGLRAPAGLTVAVNVFTFPNGVTAYSTGTVPFYSSPYYGARSVGTGNMVANRTYWVLQQAPRGITLKSIRVAANSPGTTGNVHFSVWTVDSSTGLPSTRLYVSSGATANASTFNYVTVTNASGLVGVSAGPFYLAATFSTALPTFLHSTTVGLANYGSVNYVTGYMNYLPVLDTNGFTAPTSTTQTGTTFGFIDYYPTSVTVPVIEWNHV